MDIKPRTFGRSELAQCYFPKLKPMTAWEKLKLSISLNSPGARSRPPKSS